MADVVVVHISEDAPLAGRIVGALRRLGVEADHSVVEGPLGLAYPVVNGVPMVIAIWSPGSAGDRSLKQTVAEPLRRSRLVHVLWRRNRVPIQFFPGHDQVILDSWVEGRAHSGWKALIVSVGNALAQDGRLRSNELKARYELQLVVGVHVADDPNGGVPGGGGHGGGPGPPRSPFRGEPVDVFISYARATRDKVERLRDDITGRGLSVFFDADNIDGGATFPDVIDRAVKSAGCVLGCWSPLAFTRDWVKQECRVGKLRGVLVPVAIEPFTEIDVPTEFSGVNYFDVTDWRGQGAHEGWTRTLATIGKLVGRPVG